MTGRLRPWKRLRTGRVEEHQILRVREDVWQDPRDGSEHERVIIDADEWANVVAVTPEDEVVMVRQFRFGSNEVGLEVPGGVVDKGETPEQAVRRELEEETGYRVKSVRAVGWMWTNPAHFTNRQHTFLAQGAERVHDGHQEGSEDIEVVLVPRADIPRLIRDGTIRHALHIGALTLALGLEAHPA
jgi:ADP-ribose diphosphatase